MESIYISIFVLGVAILGLSVGVIFNDKPIQGSCGGIGADEACTICGGDTENAKLLKALKSIYYRSL